MGANNPDGQIWWHMSAEKKQQQQTSSTRYLLSLSSSLSSSSSLDKRDKSRLVSSIVPEIAWTKPRTRDVLAPEAINVGDVLTVAVIPHLCKTEKCQQITLIFTSICAYPKRCRNVFRSWSTMNGGSLMALH
uniref:Uncharacterized protein n=1 Tax=Romanomermis culicivorax TaxID=13658 RepID=A0A915HEH7_ROMCU